MKKRILIPILFLPALFFSCNRDLKEIASPTGYSWARKGDTITKTDTLTFQVLSYDSIRGQYNFIVMPGYQGHSLLLNNDSSFSEIAWADVRGWNREINGKWRLSNGAVVVKRGLTKVNLRIHQYSWATFLVPESKASKFAYEFNRNKAVIDSLAPTARFLRGSEIDRHLNDLRALCFIRRLNR